MTISNVPGPTVPLYMAGAKMLTNYPTSIVVHGVALNITVQTYNESLEFGLIACGEAMPEVAELARHVEAAFDEFQALPASVVAEPPRAAARTGEEGCEEGRREEAAREEGRHEGRRQASDTACREGDTRSDDAARTARR